MKEELSEALLVTLLSLPARLEKQPLLYRVPQQRGLNQESQLFLQQISPSLRPTFLFELANLLIQSSFHHRNKVQKHPPSFAGKDGLRVKLNSFHKKMSMSDAHYLAIIQRSCSDFET